MGIRMRIAQTGAALLGAAALMAGTALPAFADTRGELLPAPDPDPDAGSSVRIAGHGSQGTRLLSLELEDGAVLRTYCVELTVNAQTGAPMVEVPWDQYPTTDGATFDENRGNVLWVLQNSFPSVDVETLSDTVGVDLDQREAIGGTQAAIWHYSNGAVLEGENNRDVEALFDYLTGPENVGVGEQPTPTLEFVGPETPGEAGGLIGPFTLNTTAERVTLGVDAPEGVQLVNQVGDADPVAVLEGEIATAELGELFLDVPADVPAGSASLTASATATVNAGRLFIGDTTADWSGVGHRTARAEMRTQSLIVAESTPTELESQVSTEWAAAPPPSTEPSEPSTPPTSESSTTVPPVPSETPETTTPAVPTTETEVEETGDEDLADTGASIWLPVIIGVVLVGGGAGALLMMRRKKTGDV